LLLQQGKGVTWAILVEFRYYFVIPILAFIYSFLLKNRVIPSALLTIILIVVSQYFWPQNQTAGNHVRLGQYLPVFLWVPCLLLLIITG
jgi:peptidoglycan/LPS O-acetylase OafA/YrhL